MPSKLDLITHAVNSKPVEFYNTFDTLMKDKVSDLVDQVKTAIAGKMFEKTEPASEEVVEEGADCKQKKGEPGYTFEKGIDTDSLVDINKPKKKKEGLKEYQSMANSDPDDTPYKEIFKYKMELRKNNPKITPDEQEKLMKKRFPGIGTASNEWGTTK